MSKELVVDRVVAYLMEDLSVPEDMIDTDVSLSEFDENAEGTMDIVVNVLDEEGYFIPVMIIQCLDDDIALEGEVLNKQIEFLEEVDNITTSGRLVVTNGNEMMYADWTGQEYDTESSLPDYATMVEEFKKTEALAKQFEEEGHSCDCGCGGHEHSHEEECDCGCGGHEHSHEEECDCGCGSHEHSHTACDCGCEDHK
ncbi:MAG: type I restriction enzyme HsdR N-terminal domain-containing protein [Clostridioides sp.]|jgi:hypothetical protein|nr:type I restriction enzyme HsdR N-terminal domain-containing protein [Clostridioides sp.]